ncbi:hypothetical protein PI126_g14821 [Phytophthora idaei]|nr:hypothetical protein PI126_g14821 [Phytophthora idaei]
MSSPSPPIAARVVAASSDAVNHLQPGAPLAATPSRFAPPPLEDKTPPPGPPVTPRRTQTDGADGSAPTYPPPNEAHDGSVTRTLPTSASCETGPSIDAASASSPSRTSNREDPPGTNAAEATTDVVVIEDAEHQTPASAPSPGRTRMRLRATETAKRLRSASRKPKRIGPATDSSLAEARQKKRKPGTASKPSAPPQLNPPAPSPDTASTAATSSRPAHPGTPPAPAAGTVFATAVETTAFGGGAAPARNPSNVSVGEMLGLDQGNCTQPHASLAAVGTEATAPCIPDSGPLAFTSISL